MTEIPFTEDPRFLEVSEAAWRVLGAGPAAIHELLAACRSDALTALATDYGADETAIFDDVLMYTMNVWSAGERAGRLDTTLTGRVFTHRLTSTEIETGVVPVYPDLVVLDADDEGHDIPLTIGDGELQSVYPDEHPDADRHGSILGPDAWLGGFAAGDLVAFRRHPDGRRVTLEKIEEPATDVVSVQALEDEVAAMRDADPAIGEDLFPIVVDALLTHPDAFQRPTLPIDALLGRIGFEHRDGFVGPADRPWEPAGVAAHRLRRSRLADAFGFDRCCSDAFDRIEDAWDAFVLGEHAPNDDDVAALDHSAVAPAFVDWVLGDGTSGSDLLERFADALVATHSRHHAGAHYVRAINRHRSGDARNAEADLRAAAELDPDNRFVALELARFAGIRGNGKEAIRLLRRTGATPDDNATLRFLTDLFQRHADTPRNDPCPCGSGRKYKVCCAVRPNLNGIDRLRWLQRKLYEFAADPARAHLTWELADAAVDADDPFDEIEIDPFGDDVFVLDLAAFERSMDDFAGQYDTMLPEDERDVLDTWRRSPRRLWEVAAVDGSAGHLTLRDDRTGETVDVHDDVAAAQASIGDAILARVADGFGHDRLVGVVEPVDSHHRDSLIEVLDTGGDAARLASWYGTVIAAAAGLDS
jgi:hypothetical protein